MLGNRSAHFHVSLKTILEVYSLYAADHLKVLINYKEFREKQPFLTQLFGEKVKKQKYLVCGERAKAETHNAQKCERHEQKGCKGVSLMLVV